MSAVRNLFGSRRGGRGVAGGLGLPSGGALVRRVRCLLPLAVLAATVTAACGGGELSVVQPAREEIHREFIPGEAARYQLPFSISGGFLPYESSIEGCPDWVTLLPDHGVLAGTAPSQDQGESFFCTYRVTEADPGFRPQRSESHRLRVDVRAINDLTLGDPSDISLSVGTFGDVELPPATGGVRPYTYSFTCAGGELPSGTGFAPETRMFAGTPDARFRDSCTYTVTDSSEPAETVSRAIEVEVTGAATASLTLPSRGKISLSVGTFGDVELPPATGGVRPYTYSFTCAGGELPSGTGFAPETRMFAGTPDARFRDSCTYTVTDSSEPAETVSRAIEVEVTPLDRGTWRFRTRSLPQSDHPLNRIDTDPQEFVTLPFAIGGPAADLDDVVYTLQDVQGPLEFDPATRVLSYQHTGTDPLFDTPTTFRYEVYEDGDDDEADDALCVDVSYRDPPPREERPNDGQLSSVRVTVRDDANWNGSEYRCPDAPPGSASSSRALVSNPVHVALAPVHARRAADVAHSAVRDRVRSWSPGGQGVLTAIGPSVGLAFLSGESGGFEYSGTSESMSAGAELGAGAWQAGVVASIAWTELHYRAEANLAERGYRSGEHDTEFLSLHPFAAWHAPSGGHVWASVGAGTGELRHRDELGFPSWSRSDARLLTYAAGGAVPVADMLSGELQAEAGIETFALEIEGGGSISSSLPTMRGRDYRAGLAWSSPLPGAPSLSVAYRHLTGDGADGGSLETQGSFSVEGFVDPRLSLTGSVEASLGLGENDQSLWGLGAGLRFAPDGLGRGFGLDVDSRLMSSADEHSSDLSILAEAGYGLGGGTVRDGAAIRGPDWQFPPPFGPANPRSRTSRDAEHGGEVRIPRASGNRPRAHVHALAPPMTPAAAFVLVPYAGGPVHRPFGDRTCEVAIAGTEAWPR